MLADLDNGVAEARLLHPSRHGYFAVMRKTAAGGVSSRMYPMQRLEDVVDAMRGAPDAYLSQASFVGEKRWVSMLSEVRAAWVDLDCYNIGAEPSDAFVDSVVARATEIGVPKPSYIVSSGRGLYAKWIFDTPIGASSLLQWNELQKCLVTLYRAIGADVKAKDAARVLRAIGTTNRKAGGGSRVQVRWSSGETHNFDELCGEVAAARFVGHLGGMPEYGWNLDGGEEPTWEAGEPSRAGRAGRVIDGSLARTDLQHLKAFTEQHTPILLKRSSSHSLNWQRFLDLRSLALARQGIGQGWRDEYLFWMLCFLSHAEVVTPKNFWDEARDLASVMDPTGFSPLADGSMKTLWSRLRARYAGQRVKTAHGERDPLYTPSNAKLIDLFCITPEEQQGLSTIISPEEKQRRADQKNPGRLERREEREARYTVVRQLIEEGVAPAEIARRTGETRKQVHRILHKHRPQAVGAPAPSACRPARGRRTDGASAAARDRAVELRLQGLSKAAIARQLQCSETTVYRLLGTSEAKRMLATVQDVRQRLELEAALEAGPPRAEVHEQLQRPIQESELAALRQAEVQIQRQALMADALHLQTEAARLRDEAARQQQSLAMSIKVQHLKAKLLSSTGSSSAAAPAQPGDGQDAIELIASLKARAADCTHQAQDLIRRICAPASLHVNHGANSGEPASSPERTPHEQRQQSVDGHSSAGRDGRHPEELPPRRAHAPARAGACGDERRPGRDGDDAATGAGVATCRSVALCRTGDPRGGRGGHAAARGDPARPAGP